MREAILVLDVGTTNFKTLLCDLAGTVPFARSLPFRPAYDAEGMVFQDPLAWRNAMVDGSNRAAAFARGHGFAVIGLSVTASRSSVIPVDRDGGHIGPAMMWQETASREIVNVLSRGDNLERIHRRTGSRPNTVFSAPKMAWLRRHRPEIYAAAHKLIGIQDYIIRFLTGEFATDHTFGSRTLLMDVRARRWDGEMLDLFGVEAEKLCRLIPPGSVAGRLLPEAAAKLGLDAGLPVVTAGGDQQNAALGAGVTVPGDVMVNMGTGGFLVAALAEPVVDPAMRMMCNASALPDKWILDAGMLTAGSVHRWLAENFYNEIPGNRMEDRYALVDAEAAASPPGADGLIALPHFSGCGAPHWENRAKGVFYGLGMNHRRRDFARAVLEGIAGEIADNLAAADELVSSPLDVRLAGGLSQSRFFNQLLADVCQRPLRRSGALEATARGAWCQAMVALDRAANHREALAREASSSPGEEYSPTPGRKEAYSRFLGERSRLFAALAAMRRDECGM